MIFSGLFFPSKYLGIKSIGPGRYREIPAIISSRLSGFNSFMKFFIPALSSWKIPSQWPVPIEASTCESFISMLLISNVMPWLRLTLFTAFCITVSVLSPRKSIFKRPSSSKAVIVYCVTTAPSLPLESGTYSSTARWLMTTPAACIDVWRGRPSSLFERSISFLTCGSLS